MNELVKFDELKDELCKLNELKEVLGELGKLGKLDELNNVLDGLLSWMMCRISWMC